MALSVSKPKRKRLEKAASAFLSRREPLELKDVSLSAQSQAQAAFREAGHKLVTVMKELDVDAFRFRNNTFVRTSGNGVVSVLDRNILDLSE